MKKVIRLTESDLERIIERVISENNQSLIKEAMADGGSVSKFLSRYSVKSGNFHVADVPPHGKTLYLTFDGVSYALDNK